MSIKRYKFGTYIKTYPVIFITIWQINKRKFHYGISGIHGRELRFEIFVSIFIMEMEITYYLSLLFFRL